MQIKSGIGLVVRYAKKFMLILTYFLLSVCLENCSQHDDYIYLRKTLSVPTRTSIMSDSASLKLFIISDWGFNGTDDQKKVADEMGKIAKLIKVNFILTCGDNFQFSGVNSIDDSQWNTNYINVYNDSSLLVPWYPALGNHDYVSHPEVEIEYSKKSNYWQMPSWYYTFVKKINSENLVRFIVLDTYGLILEYQKLKDSTKFDTIAQYCWLKKLLSGNKTEWTIITGHHPVFSASKVHGDTKEMKIMLKPLLDKYNVDFYICGHDHDFEHAREYGKNTDYIVDGTGALIRPASKNYRTVFSLSALGFTYLSVSRQYINLYFITAEGSIGYYYERKK
jgi:tartrate-resistant acid phosphatase type 5